MQTCSVFATYTNWLSRELEKADPDLQGTTKPGNMTDDQWRAFLVTRGQRQQQQASTSKDGDTNMQDDKSPETKMKELFEMIRKWENSFSRHLQILLDALNHYAATETVVLLSLCARLSTANQGTEYAGLRSEEEHHGGGP